MTLGSLIAETAYTIVYGNEGDAEFFTIVFKILVGVFLFIGLPIIFYVVRTTELVLHAEFSKLMVYGSTLTLLMLATLLLAGSAFDYQWIIFFSTTAIAWWVYSEALVWLSLAPRRMLAALAIAGLAVGAAVLIPRLLYLLDLKPDWARHASAAAILFVVLTITVAGAIVLDRHKGRLSLWRTSLSR